MLVSRLPPRPPSRLLLLAGPAMAQKQILEDRPVTMETLLDRIQIEDFLTRYYYDLSVGKAKELAEYFTEDAVLDVDGMVAKGHAEIAKLYQRPAGRGIAGGDRRNIAAATCC